MSFEVESQITGKLVKNSVKIPNKSMQNTLLLKGYGEKSEKDFVLNSFEALYLAYIKKLKISKTNKNVTFDELMNIYKKSEEDIFTKFLVYRDLRNRGYVTKNGFGFGSDFLVYEKGNFGQKGAKYLIFALNEGTQEKISHVQKNIEQITHMGKEPIIAVIERRGEVIYYKISKVNFLENKKDSQAIDFNF
jgi:tRNA-intron endonuclease|tara:strand:- start:363 stop:935 length:573 start_codon:yes stop_codon:yes gene_type:complete